MNRTLIPIMLLNFFQWSVSILIILFTVCLTSHLDASQNIIRTSNISINKQTKTIHIQSRLAIKNGILEYFLVGEQGKTYESVFKVSENKPSDLNFALLLIGCEPLNYQTFCEINSQKNAFEILTQHHKKSLVKISVLYKNKRIKMKQLLKNRENQEHQFCWVYTGGYFLKDNHYAGDIELSFIGIWADRTSVLNLCSQLKNPYQGNYGYEIAVDPEKMAINSEVEIVIERRIHKKSEK